MKKEERDINGHDLIRSMRESKRPPEPTSAELKVAIVVALLCAIGIAVAALVRQ